MILKMILRRTIMITADPDVSRIAIWYASTHFFTLGSHMQGIAFRLVQVDSSNYSVSTSIYRLGIWMEGDEGGIRIVRSAAGLITSSHQHRRVEYGPRTLICPISSLGTRLFFSFSQLRS